MSDFRLKNDLMFGCYVTIEQKRYGAENEHYIHKVIGTLISNAYVSVPVDMANTRREEIVNSESVPVVACVCCGVSEREIRRYRVEDVKPYTPQPKNPDQR